VALQRMYGGFDAGTVSPEMQRVYESIFLERREHQRRGVMPSEFREPRGQGAGATASPASPPVRQVAQPTPVPRYAPKRIPSIERRESLRDMARRIGAKTRRA
jgi:hypothetical protein